MTSEPDSAPRRRPPTIDLTATEVRPEQPAAAAGASSGPAEPAGEAAKPSAEPPVGTRSHAWAVLTGVLAALISVGAVAGGLWYSGLLPLREPASGAAAPATDNSVVAEISAQLKKIEGALQTRQTGPAAEAPPDSRMAAAEAQTKSLSDQFAALTRRVDEVAAAQAQTKALGEQLAALTRRIDEMAAASQTALAQAKAAAAAADEAKTAAGAAKTAASALQRADLDALASRIAILERAIKANADELTRRTASADDRVARLTVAAEALRATVERGAPFAAELDAVKALGADQGALAALSPFAASGVPSNAVLAHDLAGLIPALRQAAGTPKPPDTILGRLESNAQRLVRITPVDAPAGNDPSAVIARLAAEAAQADVAAALADIPRLPEPLRTVVAPWVQRADARNAALAASRRIAADAVAAIGKTAPQ